MSFHIKVIIIRTLPVGSIFLNCDRLQLYTPSRRLRSAPDTLSLQIPRTRLSTVGSRAFSVLGASTWSDLPRRLRQKPSLDSFKCNLKTFLFSRNCRPAMFSVMCCCFHPSPVSKLCKFKHCLVRMLVCVCACACVRACVRVCVCARACA